MRALFALFVRSVREDARARLPPILRATLVLIILLILWANERNFTQRTAPGREFLGMVLFANLGLIAIATPGIFASAMDVSLTASRIFGEERRELTLSSLVTLPKTTGSLIRQKILGSLPALLPSVALVTCGFWLRFVFTADAYYTWRHLLRNDRVLIFYIASQFLLLPILVANLSLRIRRGAMPAGIPRVAAAE